MTRLRIGSKSMPMSVSMSGNVCPTATRGSTLQIIVRSSVLRAISRQPRSQPLSQPRLRQTRCRPRPCLPSSAALDDRTVGSVLLLRSETGQRAHVGLRFGLAFVGAKPVIEVVDHLGLVEREHASAVRTKTLPSGSSHHVPADRRPEQAGVVRHVEHAHERQAPGILLGVIAPEDGDALVDADGDLGVASGVGRSGMVPVFGLTSRISSGGMVNAPRQEDPACSGRRRRSLPDSLRSARPQTVSRQKRTR